MLKFLNLNKKKKPQDLKEVLSRLKKIDEQMEELGNALSQVKKMAEFSVQKIGFKRYNPFDGMGGDQSFSIALLDSKNNGFIISNLYSREGTRIYAKPVKDGKSEYQLSDEEKGAIEQATAQ